MFWAHSLCLRLSNVAELAQIAYKYKSICFLKQVYLLALISHIFKIHNQKKKKKDFGKTVKLILFLYSICLYCAFCASAFNVFGFFFFFSAQRLLQCSWDINNANRQMNSTRMWTVIFLFFIFYFQFSILSFQQNKLYLNRSIMWNLSNYPSLFKTNSPNTYER